MFKGIYGGRAAFGIGRADGAGGPEMIPVEF
jgi:hypothetical protein